MAGERGVMAKYDVFRHWLARPHRVEEGREMRRLLVKVGTANRDGFFQPRFARLGIMLAMPLLLVCFAQRPGIAAGVVTRPVILTGLRRELDLRSGDLE